MDKSGQLHAPAALPRGKQPPGTQCIGGGVGSGATLDVTEKGEVTLSLSINAMSRRRMT
jgi:hypothetical protein